MSNAVPPCTTEFFGRAEGPAKNTFRKHGMRNNRRRRVWNMTGGRCYYCGHQCITDALLYGENPMHPDRMHIEHIQARSNGGKCEESNFVPACRTCNCRKGVKDVEEFRLRLSRKKAQMPEFTNEQIKWLGENGFEFPTIEIIRFYGETLNE